MILISHRGNIFGPNSTKENNPLYIDTSIDFGVDCEIDLHFINDCFFLGHDIPQYKIDLNWLCERKNRLWIHCKNLPAISFLNILKQYDFNYFWHESDTVTLTSKGYIWSYPGNQPIKNSIAIMPEIHNDNIDYCIGVCSDYIEKYFT